MDYAIKALDPIEALVLETPDDYGAERILPDGRKFVYCYTALTSLIPGSVVCIELDSGDAINQNPRAVLPATSSIQLLMGVVAGPVAASTGFTAAGGIWVQVRGRCTVICLDGGTDVGINDFLKAVNAAHYLVVDHVDTATISAMAISECVETYAVAAQTPSAAINPYTGLEYAAATYGDPTGQGSYRTAVPRQIYLLERRATVA